MGHIEDAGEVIPHARKHVVGSLEKRHNKAVSNNEKINKIKLSELWPEPNWCQLKKQGVEPEALVVMYTIYSNIRKSPRSGNHWGVESEKWENAYIQSLLILQKIFSVVKTLDHAKAIKDLYKTELKKRVPDYSEQPNHIDNRYAWYCTGTCNSRRKISNAFNRSLKDNLVAKWLVFNGWPENDDAAKYNFYPIEMEDNTWRVAETNKVTYSYFDIPVSEKEALEISRTKNLENFPAGAQTVDLIKEPEHIPIFVPKKKKGSDDERIGPSFRNGNISSDELIETFGFRGVQFGNALSDLERQTWLNDSFDAFHDLAEMLGFKPNWIGLRSRNQNEKSLGIAFGARGLGGTGAAAHYERELNVINMTRASGYGSGAHEFGHGLDARIGRALSIDGYVTENLHNSSMLIYTCEEDSSRFTPKQISQIKAFDDIMKQCGNMYAPSNYFNASEKLASQKRARKYWTKNVELFARAFESCIQDKLAREGRNSPWLVNGTTIADCEPGRESMWPYPSGEERGQLNKLFESLFSTLT